MQSATILCVTFFVVQFELRIPPSILSEVLKTISVRMVSPPTSVVKASLDLLVIVIGELPDALLEQHLMDLLTSLLQWLGGGDGQTAKQKLRAKSNKCLDLL